MDQFHEVPIAGGPLTQPDYVEYHIFLAKFESSDERGKERELLTWKALIMQELEQYTQQYIWQREPFQLKVYSYEKGEKQKLKQEPHLYGKTSFGENLDDEWFIVFLLLALSKKFPELLIRVWDTDGEFLLIEAALLLPRWLTPERAEDRLWIRAGRLQLIPRPSQAHPNVPAKIDRPAALRVLREGTVSTKLDDMITKPILERVQEYPQKALRTHNCSCLLPLPIAQILKKAPEMIAPAVDAFYDRDMDGMKALTKMAKFSPAKSPSVLLRVKFSQHLFAQLSKQRFPAPPSFHLPPAASPQFKAADLGMKITCGFEILSSMSEKGKKDHLPLLSDAISSYDFENDEQWKAFKESLTKRGFLGPSSSSGDKAEQRAKYIFLENYHAKEYRTIASTSSRKLVEYLSTPSMDTSEFPTPGLPDDPEKWLEVSPQEVDDILAKKQKEIDDYEKQSRERKKGNEPGKDAEKDKPNEENSTAKKEDMTVDEIISNVRSFVHKKSGLEGVEAANSTPPTEAKSNLGVDFDPQAFLKTMQKTLDYDRIDSEDDESDFDDEEDDEEYGEEYSPEEEEEMRKEIEEFKEYLKAMDMELEGTSMGQSFERVQNQKGEEKEKKSAEGRRKTGVQEDEDSEDEEDEEEAEEEEAEREGGAKKADLAPVDLDMNLVKNLLESVAGQQGGPGPFTSLLAELQRGKGK